MDDTVKATAKPTVYPPAEASPSFPKIEEAVGKLWVEEGTFQTSIDRRRKDGAEEFVFYDGPPFANGLPHYGHIVTGFVKDIVPRYQTMRGKLAERRFGWDCHGLPAELHSETELKLSGRRDIVKYGVAKFNEHCRTSVMQFRSDWEYYVNRSARWVDFENDYRTMDLDYMESTMWAFKQLWDKGLIYEGFRVVPYSWAAQTPLSNFETRLDDSYRPRQDPALTVTFSLDARDGEAQAPKILAWTTTPWTLPSNMGLAVDPEADYVVMQKDGERVILAEASRERYAAELEGYALTDTVKGAALIGRTYAPLFPFFAERKGEGGFRVVAADFIEMGEGTGVVHMAPAFGEDDLVIGQKEGLPVVDPVDLEGNFTDLTPPYAGMNVFVANKEIIRDLKAAGAVVRHETYEHNYPHCWRTDEPLIYKAMPSWYVKVIQFRERMVELNQDIRWMPEHIRDGAFGNWLANARDWNIGRNRFWGAPIPVWKSDDPAHPRTDVYGSLDEFERDFGARPTDLHRPYVDELTRPNPDDPTGKSTMRRVEDVLDCWFESGSMPFCQVHYPFENKEWFESHFPGDFIVEYVGQTRGWFYTLMVMATALFDKAPFRSAIGHGIVLDENKQKLSKRLKNYPDPVEMFNTYGADALRWYMISSPLMSGGDLAMPKDGKAIGDAVRQVILPIWNAYSFFTLYANIDGIRGSLVTTADAELDRYILGKTAELVRAVEDAMEGLDLAAACDALPSFIEALNNWYIRRSRDRFWKSEKDADKQAAYDTLYTVLVTLVRAMAPYLPYLTDHIHRALCDGASVHLEDWPDAEAFANLGDRAARVSKHYTLDAEPASFASAGQDVDLISSMDLAREVVSAAASVRSAKNLRNRLPLRRLTVAHPGFKQLVPLRDLIAEEANVKEVMFSAEPSIYGAEALAVDSRIVGKRVGKAMKEVLANAKAGVWHHSGNGKIIIPMKPPQDDLLLEPGEYELRFKAREGFDAAPFDDLKGVVVLDTEITPELEREGLARDFIRLVQVARKDAGFNVADRIHLEVKAGTAANDAIVAHLDAVKHETLAVSFDRTGGIPAGHVSEAKLADEPIAIGVRVAG